jgi:tellurite resistance protein TerC
MSTKKSLMWIVFWAALAMGFNAFIYFFMGQQKALEFLGGYIIEQTLSLDNLFLFLLIFESFAIPSIYQRRVLNYGIIGAVILRLIFILLGVAIISKFHWLLYVFGLVLIVSGVKMFAKKDDKEDSENVKNSPAIKILSKVIPVTDKLHEEKFFMRINKVLYATPLMAILVLIEFSDIIFAVDSIPAIFSITTDPFIVYTSNIFAILGLRNMYFLLEKLHKTFALVKYGVAAILVFTGIKLSILFFHIEIPIIVSLSIIFMILILSILISVMVKNNSRFAND